MNGEKNEQKEKKPVITVYAICKNEKAFVRRWLVSMSEADHICVLDTGSDDGTVEEFKAASAALGIADKLIIDVKVISPWRFDVARNENMKQIPDDTDIIISTDLDEVLAKGWSEKLAATYKEKPGANCYYYLFAWSHDEKNNPTRIISYNKCSPYMKGEIYWKYPCHETLTYTETYKQHHTQGGVWIEREEPLLFHFPDNSKSRGGYLKLLELRAEESPEDLYGLFYLAREYTFKAMNDKALAAFAKLYGRLNQKNDDMMMLSPTAMEMAKLYSDMKDHEKEAEFFYKRAIELCPTFRDPYIYYARWLAYRGRNGESLNVLNDGINKTVRRHDWREVDFTWAPWCIDHIRAINLSWFGMDEEALALFARAEMSFASETEKNDARWFGFFADKKFVEGKIKRKLSIRKK